jgi:glycosyltransferase involved in cell wall biosynthesis
MSESTQIDRGRVWWKESVKRKIVSRAQAAFVGGTRHAEYLVTLGMPPERIAFGYDVVDNTHFSSTISDGEALDCSSIGFQLQRGKYFLSCSRFIAEKNIFGLIEAYWRYVSVLRQRGKSPWPLVLLGDGEQRASIEVEVNRLQLNDLIVLTGYQPYDVLPKYYRHAGVFVLASVSEPWGLVVNEAMASGLPVLVSNRCGCAPDLVVPGHNGFVFDPSDIRSLSVLLERVAEDDCDRHAMGSASLEIIANWGLTRFAEGMKKAAEIALSVPVRSASILDYQILRHLSER